MERQRIDSLARLFEEGRHLAPEERAGWIARECAEDPDLAAELGELLDVHDTGSGFLEPATVAAVLRSWMGGRLDEGTPAAGPPADAPRPATLQVPGFRILSVLGGGAQGAVYEAEQERPRRTVALKVLLPQRADEEFRKRFEREAETLGRLHHPGLAVIHGSGVVATEFGELPWFAMELVRGRSLTEHASAAGLDTAQRLELLARVCDAVEHAHAQGVVHRDLKPSNILVDDEGRPRILDFGIARVVDPEVQATTLQTDPGQVLGTLQYMSPEQASGRSGEVDARADVFSLGVLAFELLTGRLPRALDDRPFPEALRLVAEGDTTLLGRVDRSLRGDLETIVGKAMAREPERRYADAGALAADLRRHLADEPVLARPASTFYQVRRLVRRHRPVTAALALLVLVLLYAGLMQWHARREAARQDYRAAVTDAQLALQAERYPEARRLLDGTPAGLRGWEWRHLDEQLSGGPEVFAQEGLELAAVHQLPDGEFYVVDLRGGVTRRAADWAACWSRPEIDKALAVDPALDRLVAISKAGPLVLELSTGELVRELPPLSRDARLMEGHFWDDGRLLSVRYDAGWALDELITGVRRHDALGSRRLAHLSRDLSWAATWIDDELRFIDPFLNALEPERGPWRPRAGHGWTAFSPDERLVAVTDYGRIELHDLAGRTSLWVADGHADKITELAFTPDGRTLVTAGRDEAIRFWDAATGEHLASLPALFDGLPARVSFTPDGRSLLAWGAEEHHGWDERRDLVARREVHRWDLGVLEVTDVLPHGSYVYPVAWSPDGELLATAEGEGTVRLFDARSGEAVWAHRVGTDAGELVFDPPRGRLLVALRQGLRAVDLTSGATSSLVDGARVQRLALTPDGSQLLATGVIGNDGAAELLRVDLATDTVVGTIPLGLRGGSRSLTLEPGGRRAVVAVDGGDAVVVDLDDERSTPLAIPASRAAWSPDGRWLAVVDEELVRVLDDDLTEVARLEGHSEIVYALTWSPDGERLLSGARDATIRVWDPEDWAEVARLEGHEDYVYSLAFSPDGADLASSSGDGTVRLWRTTPRRELLLVRRAAREARPAARALVSELEAAGLAPAALRIRAGDTPAPPGVSPAAFRRELEHALRRVPAR